MRMNEWTARLDLAFLCVSAAVPHRSLKDLRLRACQQGQQVQLRYKGN